MVTRPTSRFILQAECVALSGEPAFYISRVLRRYLEEARSEGQFVRRSVVEAIEGIDECGQRWSASVVDAVIASPPAVRGGRLAAGRG